MLRIFVRIGALKRFHVLKQRTADLPVVVDWDRRRGERRAPGEDVTVDRRLADRRRDPPFTWESADFVVEDSPKERREGVLADTGRERDEPCSPGSKSNPGIPVTTDA